MKGRVRPLSLPRRIIADLMRVSIKTPLVPVQRMMNLDALAAARAASPVRLSWVAIFVKAYALVAVEFPELRRAYTKFPWPHLYEYQHSIAIIAIERTYEGELAVFGRMFKQPEIAPLGEISQVIEDAKNRPIEEIKDFTRVLNAARLPAIFRRPLWWYRFNLSRPRANSFGTFGVSVVSSLGAEILSVPVATTTLLTFGVIMPGQPVPVRMLIDHRVLDGAVAARVLARLEEILNGEILQELRS